MSSATFKVSDGRQQLLDGLARFAQDHDLSVDTSVSQLARKFLVITANGIDCNVAYPMIADDLSTVMFRVGERAPLYRSTNTAGFTYPATMWQYIFSQSDVGDFAPVALGGADDMKLEGYRHFKSQLNAKKQQFAAFPEWKKLLAFYMGAHVHRNASAVCSELLGMEHTLFQDELEQLRPQERAEALGAVIKHMTFEKLEDPEFHLVLRDPALNRANGSRVDDIASAAQKLQPWDAPAKAVGNTVSTVPSQPPAVWDLIAQKTYRAQPLVQATADRIGEFTPLHMVFHHIVGDVLQSGTDMPAAEWHGVLSLINHAQLDDVMACSEMQHFLRQVANNISTSDFTHWAARDATKKLLTAHTPDWKKKWATEWVMDEPLERAVNAHLNEYPKASAALVKVITQLNPE